MKPALRFSIFPRPLLGLLFLAFFFTSFGHGQAPASPFTSVVVFGDSLSDTGNVAHVVQSNFGVRYPGPTFNYTDGRFTDGTDTTPAVPPTPGNHQPLGVWHEQFTKLFTGLIPAKNSLDGGLNYAYGAATTHDGTSVVSGPSGAGATVSITVENMGMQVNDYLTRPGMSVDPKALHILWGGGDDLFADATVTNIVDAPARITALANKLAAAGAVYILIPNLPPLGSTPGLVGQPIAIAALNAATAAYNAQLASDLDALQAGFTTAGSNVHIYRLDIYTLFQNIAASPATYGFTDIVDAAQGKTSVDPDAYLFWDDVHPTTTGHLNIATAAYDAIIPKVTLTITPASPAAPGEAVTFTAVVTSPNPPVPTGTVTFYDQNATPNTLLGTATLDGTGTATLTSSSLAPGAYAIAAVYGGDASHFTSTSTNTAFQIAAATTTTLTISPSQAAGGSPVTLTATVTGPLGVPVGGVAFLDGGTPLPLGSNITLNASGVATYTISNLAAGTHAISATYPGNSIYLASTSAPQSVTVTATATATTLTSSINPAGTGQAVVFTAAVAPSSGAGVPTGTVTFTEGTTSLGTGTLDGTGKATLSLSSLAVGAHAVIATYAGDGSYLGSASAALTETIITPSITFSATPPSLTIARGAPGTATITGTPVGGFSGVVSFTCGTLPVDASCSFAPASLTFAGAPLTTTLTVSTKLATASFQPLEVRPAPGPTMLAVLSMPWLGVAGVAMFRKRKPGADRARTLLMVILLSVVALAGMTACGSASNTTPKGTYPVTVTATGGGAASTLAIQVTVQ